MVDKEKAFIAFEKFRQESPGGFRSTLERMRKDPDLAPFYIYDIYRKYGPEGFPAEGEFPAVFQTEGEFPVPPGTLRSFYADTDIIKQYYPEKYQELLKKAQDNPLAAAQDAIKLAIGLRGVELLPLFQKYIMQSLPEYKERVLRPLKEDMERRLRKERGKQRAMRGAGWLLLGALITGATYLFAEPGETYMICWGAMGFGALYFFLGLIEWLDLIEWLFSSA